MVSRNASVLCLSLAPSRGLVAIREVSHAMGMLKPQAELNDTVVNCVMFRLATANPTSPAAVDSACKRVFINNPNSKVSVRRIKQKVQDKRQILMAVCNQRHWYRCTKSILPP